MSNPLLGAQDDHLEIKFAPGGVLPPVLHIGEVVGKIVEYSITVGHDKLSNEELEEIYGGTGSMKLFDAALGPFTFVVLDAGGAVIAHSPTQVESVLAARRVCDIVSHAGLGMFGKKVAEVRLVTRDGEMLPGIPDITGTPAALPVRPMKA